MSRRKTDSRGEKAIGVFLDKYFYPTENKNGLFTYAKRIYEREMQIKGVDVLLDDVKVDEKAQLYYINKPRETFAFEIDYFDETKGSVIDGWFIADNLTDEYMLMWVQEARTNKIHRLVAEDFERVEIDLIKKKRLKSYLDKLGITNTILKKNAINMRENDTMRLPLNDKCYLRYSFDKDYSEKPINLVINKDVIDELSEGRYMVTKEKVINLI